MNSLTHLTNDIPWQRLTTAYGRGTDIPRLIETGQYAELANLIEHQSTLWQTTPWVLLILLQELAKQKPERVSSQEIQLYLAVASAINVDEMDSQNTVETMNELLDEKYLWPEDEEDDELWWEEEEPRGYEQEAFFSYFSFSYSLLKDAIPVFTEIMEGNDKLAPDIRELLLMLQSEGASAVE
ncbi:hypothetical protein [Brevibacillus brevis]|uniref:hypothetical protein n=1 Tax=Brevibacillus brevis TaxID=1393 RepID=UPI000D0F43F5|nr:hypothetical protein [Brevibacillus brevis]PSJ63559.1 hypothetical protein C7J99_31135 [Brevibacillus brevis]RED33880.1 hypothetical protein DES34_10245 [Brevibacillus brevis]GEC89390.1 hypothetical protein BBR01nite_17210 [Brevibacillus brevis]VEF92550.1 Uncharacterised protein [Brevibacillus brevis]